MPAAAATTTTTTTTTAAAMTRLTTTAAAAEASDKPPAPPHRPWASHQHPDRASYQPSGRPVPTPRSALLVDPVDGTRLEHRRLRLAADATTSKKKPRPHQPGHLPWQAPDRSRIYGPFSAQSSSDVLNVKRRIQHARRYPPPPPSMHQSLERRQNSTEDACWVGNDVLSCYPTAGTDVVQGQWSKFIWNSNFPRFIQIGAVDIYLFRDDGDTAQTSWTSVPNTQRRISFSPEDSWWQDLPQAANIQPGQNISWPFYFVVTGAGLGTSSGLTRQSTWSAVQTALPTSIAKARSSSSSQSLASASAASASSLSAASSASLSSAEVGASSSLWSATHTLSGNSLSSYVASVQSSETASVVSMLSTSIETSLRSEGFTGTQTGLATLTTTLPDGHTVTAQATAQADGGALQGQARNNASHSLPRYAIGLIAAFGTVAFLLALAAGYLVWRKCLRRSSSRYGLAVNPTGAAAQKEKGTGGSLHSATPMLAPAPAASSSNSQSDVSLSSPRSPLSAPWAQENGPLSSPALGTTSSRRGPLSLPSPTLESVPSGAGASLAVPAGPPGAQGGGARPLSLAAVSTAPASSKAVEEQGLWSDEASRMADAFRNALRQPSFSFLPESLRSVSSNQGNATSLPPVPPVPHISPIPSAPSSQQHTPNLHPQTTSSNVDLPRDQHPHLADEVGQPGSGPGSGSGTGAAGIRTSTTATGTEPTPTEWGDTTVMRTILPLPVPSRSSSLPTPSSPAGSAGPAGPSDASFHTSDHRPTLSQLLQQELARDGMEMHTVSQSKPTSTTGSPRGEMPPTSTSPPPPPPPAASSS